MASDLQAAFPQFDLQTIMSVVESEVTSEASARKLSELDHQRNQAIAEQYAKTLKQQERLREESRRKNSIKDDSKISPKLQINDDALPKTEVPKVEVAINETEPVIVTKDTSIEKVSLETPTTEEAKTFLIPSPSYSDLASPAVDLLLRGFGGREKHAPEKTTPPIVPSASVESNLETKETSATSEKSSNSAKEQTAASPQDLASRKEARRKARMERRKRQQLEREAANKLQNADQSAMSHRSRQRRHDERKETAVHLTPHSNKDRLTLSQSTPVLNKLEASDGNKSVADSTDGKQQMSRQGASSGYDTGTEWHQDMTANVLEDEQPQKSDEPLHNNQPKTERKAVKYVCGPKYESSTSRAGQKSKPNKYEAKKNKRYSNRRKTLNYEHYTADQDRSSL